MSEVNGDQLEANRFRRKSSAALLSVFSNSTLIVLKLIVGFSIGSISVISEAIHSGVDLIASFIAFFGVRKSAKPADDRHPYGHGKLENISATLEALLIFLAAGWIIYEAFKKFVDPHDLKDPFWGAAIMLLSAVVNIVVSQRLFKVSRETESLALQADAWHLRTDVYTSLGVMVGLAGLWLGQLFFPQTELRWIDPAAAILVALLIIKAAYHLVIESGKDLLDVSLPAEEENAIKKIICSYHPDIKGYHCLRTRKSGSERFIELHIQVNADMTVERSHQIADQITRSIKDYYASSNVIVHVEPCNGNCTPRCLMGCLLDKEQRLKIQEMFSKKELGER